MLSPLRSQCTSLHRSPPFLASYVSNVNALVTGAQVGGILLTQSFDPRMSGLPSAGIAATKSIDMELSYCRREISIQVH